MLTASMKWSIFGFKENIKRLCTYIFAMPFRSPPSRARSVLHSCVCVCVLLWFPLFIFTLILTFATEPHHPLSLRHTRYSHNRTIDMEEEHYRVELCDDRFSALIWFRNRLFDSSCVCALLSFIRKTTCVGEKMFRLIDETRERNWRWWRNHHCKDTRAHATHASRVWLPFNCSYICTSNLYIYIISKYN